MNRLNYIKYVLLVTLAIQGCAKSIERDNPLDGKTLPFVTTVPHSNPKSTSVTAGGNITNNGGLDITSKGIIYSKAPNAPILPANTYEAGPGFSNFSIELNGLTPATTYYYKSYATNLLGTAYGNEMNFKTANDKPSITTNPPSASTSSSITIGGTIISSNGLPVTQKGVVVSTTNFVDTNSAKIFAQSIVRYDLTSSTTFSVNVPNLTEAKPYFIMAFARNALGVKFGNIVPVTTAANKPTILTTQVTNNTGKTAKSGGIITSNGGSSITARGILWSTTKGAKIESTILNFTNLGSGPTTFPSTFTSDLINLEPGKFYYVQAYARNAIDVAYGAEIEFQATPVQPEIAPASLVNSFANSVEVRSSIIYDGGSPVLDFGFVYHTSPNPTLLTNGVIKEPYGNNTNGISRNINFSSSIQNLQSGVKYYITSYLKTKETPVYGIPVLTFTPASTKPKVSTLSPSPSDIGFNSAKITGLVVDNGGATVTEKGVVVGESNNPTINGYGTLRFPDLILTDLKNISVTATNLKAGTTYYARAYAKNSVDFGYGDQISFPTKDSKPVLQKITPSNPTFNSIVVNGAITESFGLDITEKGFIWSKLNTLDINSNNYSGKEPLGKGLSSFSHTITNLLPGTLYYVRSYATSASGTGQSDPSPFTTFTTTPSITSYNDASVIGSNATLKAQITSDGGANIISAGFIVSLTSNATPNSTNQFYVQNPSVGDISHTRTGLTRGTYFYRAFAQNKDYPRVDGKEYSFVIK
jgi:hypothetical protein